MKSLNADADRFCTSEIESDLALAHNRALVLGNLISRREIGIKVILAVENACEIDLRLQSEAGADGLLDTLSIDHREHSGHCGIDKADLLVWARPKRRGCARKQFCVRQNLGVNFHPDDDFPIACRATDKLRRPNAAHGVLHQADGRTRKSAATSTARPTRSTVSSSK